MKWPYFQKKDVTGDAAAWFEEGFSLKPPLPPLPSGPVDMDRPDVDFDRWNWEQDIQPYIEHRLRTLLFRLINEPDERQIRTLQGEARELYALLHAKEEQKALAQYRAQNERARR